MYLLLECISGLITSVCILSAITVNVSMVLSWLIPDYDKILININTKILSIFKLIKFCITVSPPKPHEFVEETLQNNCIHDINGFCQACFNIKHQAIINCSHKWVAFTQTSLAGTACDFGSPVHVVTNTALTYTCELCHAICCTGCFAG